MDPEAAALKGDNKRWMMRGGGLFCYAIKLELEYLVETGLQFCIHLGPGIYLVRYCRWEEAKLLLAFCSPWGLSPRFAPAHSSPRLMVFLVDIVGVFIFTIFMLKFRKRRRS